MAAQPFFRPEDVSRVPVTAAGVVKAAVAGKRHYVIGGWLTLSADGTIKFAGSVTGDLTGAMDWAGKGGMAIPQAGDLVHAVVMTGVNEDLSIATTGGIPKGVVVVYTE